MMRPTHLDPIKIQKENQKEKREQIALEILKTTIPKSSILHPFSEIERDSFVRQAFTVADEFIKQSNEQ